MEQRYGITFLEMYIFGSTLDNQENVTIQICLIGVSHSGRNWYLMWKLLRHWPSILNIYMFCWDISSKISKWKNNRCKLGQYISYDSIGWSFQIESLYILLLPDPKSYNPYFILYYAYYRDRNSKSYLGYFGINVKIEYNMSISVIHFKFIF